MLVNRSISRFWRSAGIFLLFLPNLSAQEHVSAAENKLVEVTVLLEKGAVTDAGKVCKEAVGLFKQEKNLAGWLGAQRQLANITNLQKEPFKAIAGIDEALAQMPQKPATPSDFRALSSLYMFKSWLAKNVGNFELVKSTLEQALENFKNNLDRALPGHADYIYLQLGNAYARLGEYEGARQMFEAGIAYSLEFEAPEVAKYNDYGSMYQSQGLDSLALEIFIKGEKHPDLPAYQKVLLRLNEAECLAKLGRIKEATAVNQVANTMLHQFLDKGTGNYWRCMYGLQENFAFIAEERGQYAEALSWYHKAIESTQQISELELRIQAGLEYNAAKVYLQLGQPEKALTACAGALRLIIPDYNFVSGDLPVPDQIFAENLLIPILQTQAAGFTLLGNPDRALLAYELIPFVETELRSNHNYESSSLYALQESRKRFDKAVEVAWELYTKTNDERFAFRAFNLTEHARGLLLLESLASAQADFKLPEALAKQQNDLNVQINWYERQIASTRQLHDSGQVRKLEQELYELKLRKDKLDEKLKAEVPGYAELFREPELLQANRVPEILPTGGMLLAYYLNDLNIHIFFFGPETAISWRKEPMPAGFRENIRQFAAYLSNLNESGADKPWFLRQSFALYHLLAEKELKNASLGASLTIVPDDVLSFVPFEVLLRKETDLSAIWPKQPFLIRDFPISYAYSATLLKMQQQITRTHKPGRQLFAGFAPSYDPRKASTKDQQVANLMRGGMYDLRGTHEELRKVNALVNGDPFDGSTATEARFKQVAANYRILLLSMHGLADEENPVLSRMLFGDANSDGKGEDNILYASELQIMRLQADLAVLSACHTGFGKWHKGEGVYSLARAFAAAGVPATVMSLWRLPDATAPILIEGFFKNLKAGMSKDEALRQAKIAFLDNKENFEMSHPGYWSGVVANGDMSPLPINDHRVWAWALVIAAVLIAGLWYFRKALMTFFYRS